MEPTKVLTKTKLKDRVLWFDGDSTVPVESILQFIQLGISTSKVYTDVITDEISQFNKYVDVNQQIIIKKSIKDLDFSWNIPNEYKNLNIIDYVYDKLEEKCNEEQLNSDDWDTKSDRIAQELTLYQKLELIEALRMIIYVINTLETNNVVWGVGRGSSVSSYVLYLIGVHDVDSIKYDLDINDFLRT